MKKRFQQLYTFALVAALLIASAAKPLPPSEEQVPPGTSIVFQTPDKIPSPPFPEPVPIEKD